MLTITIESKKRYKRMVVAFALCISLLIGSAFAVHPVKTVVSMPDPYGIMPLSMNESTDASIAFSGSVVFGGYSSSYRKTFSSGFSYSGAKSSGNVRLDYYSPSTSIAGVYMKVNSGSYFDYVCNVNVSNTEYQSIVLGGGGTCRLVLYRISGGNLYSYPDTVQMMVNGVLVGDTYSVSSSAGTFTIPDLEVVLNSSVTTVGFRCSWSSADTQSSSSTSNSNQRSLDLYWVDNISITPVAIDAVDYTPWLDRIISWEQSIYGAINALGDSLSSSLGGVGESATKIASVFARDDDIQLRDDVDDTLKEVTTQFYDQTSPSSSSMTVETVQNVKGISDGMDAMFSSGYSVSDVFTEIADNDDFMSWFTAETAQALDSTGNVATVDDEDKYNMHFYYDQVNAIAERRGD